MSKSKAATKSTIQLVDQLQQVLTRDPRELSIVLPKRWIVQHTYMRLNHGRRPAKIEMRQR